MPTARKKVARRRVRLDRVAQKRREVAIIADLKAGNLSYRMIAQKHKVSLPTVNSKARKAGISRPRGRRPASATVTAVKLRRRGRATKAVRTVRSSSVRRGHPASKTRTSTPGFQEAFREMVLRYYPRITLKEFDRLARMVSAAIK